ncbi:tripartite tricarboxylate transporter substrate binding protein [Candidimonas humi]|nr:tripartite tricarboxylate transporter substrate binding protein [Candidimonas humi]
MSRSCAMATILWSCAGYTATFPNRPLNLIVPFVPGGSSDITARAIQPALTQELGQTVIIENKPGANGGIGAAELKRAKPDGYTMMVGSIGTYAINPSIYKKLAYDPTRDFRYLTEAVRTPNVLVVNPKLDVHDVAGLLAYAKQHPESMSYACSGMGASEQLSAALFRLRTHSPGVDVPYRGGGAAISDTLSGQIKVMFMNLGAVLPYIRAGQLRALAVTSEHRIASIPDVPTMQEAGISDMVVYSWQSIAVPKATPTPVVERLSKALRTALVAPKSKAVLEKQGYEVVANSWQDADAWQHSETARWAKVVKDAGIHLN